MKTAAVKPPSLFAFNHEVIIDVFHIHDMARGMYGFLSIVDNGTGLRPIASRLSVKAKGLPRLRSAMQCSRRIGVPGRATRRWSQLTEARTIGENSPQDCR